MADALYIHPHGHLVSDTIVPAGAITTMNALSCSKKGVYSSNMTTGDIRAARVILIGIHWPFALTAAKRIIAHARHVNPDARFVIGGYTAALFARRALALTGADYAITHNSEPVTAKFVESLARGERVKHFPNVMSRRGTRGPLQDMTNDEFNQLDFIDASWFPEYWNAGHIKTAVMLTRGCRKDFLEITRPRASRCILKRAHPHSVLFRTPRTLEIDLNRLQELSRRVPVSCDLFIGRAPEKYMRDCFRLVNRKWNYHIFLYACNTLCRAMFSMNRQTPEGPGIDSWISLACVENPGLAHGGLLSKSQARSLANNLNESGMYRVNPARPHFPRGIFVSSRLSEPRFEHPINWVVPPLHIKFKSAKQEFLYYCRFALISNKLALLKILCPGIYEHYGFSSDPIYKLPGPIADNTDPFHKSVHKGYKQWGTPVPDQLHFSAWAVTMNSEARDAQGFAAARDMTMLLSAQPMKAAFRVDESGWSLEVALQPLTHHAPPGGSARHMLVFLPLGLERMIGAESSMRIFATPAPNACGQKRPSTIIVRATSKHIHVFVRNADSTIAQIH